MGVPDVTVYWKPVTASVLWKLRVMTASPEAARDWFLRGCEKGDPAGCRYVGALYLEGRGVPKGLRVPLSPVANWSRLTLPSSTAPAASSLATTGASSAGV